MKEIGLLKHNTEFHILEGDFNDYYICKNVEIFNAKDHYGKFRQQIKRIISNTVFCNNATIEFYDFHHKDTIAFLREKFPEDTDPLLLSAVKLGEGADYAEQLILSKITKVLKYEEISNLVGAGGLPAGLGFDGNAFAIIIAEVERQFIFEDEKIVILEEVESGGEGYSVNRTKITKELYHVCRTIKGLW